MERYIYKSFLTCVFFSIKHFKDVLSSTTIEKGHVIMYYIESQCSKVDKEHSFRCKERRFQGD